MTMSGRRVSVVLAVVLLMGVLVALAITQATAQDNPNSQPSTSKVAADTGSQGVQSTTLKKVLWAVVRRDGTLARGKGALSATQFGVDSGTYGVRFDRDVTRCVYAATIGLSAVQDSPTGTSPPGEITVAPLSEASGAPNGVFVSTHNSTGTTESRAFHLALNCPGR
jgi:hypothetical protein